MRSVVITGMGVVSGYGAGKHALSTGVSSGKSSILSWDCGEEKFLNLCGGRAKVVDDEKARLDAPNRSCELALKAVEEACREAQAQQINSSMLVASVGWGWPKLCQSDDILWSVNQCQRDWVEEGVSWLKQKISHWHLFGTQLSVCSACAASLCAVIHGARSIALGKIDQCLAGGGDSRLSDVGLAAYARLGALASGWENEPWKACRPFDEKRTGFIPGEGAGFVWLEEEDHARKRGAVIYARLSGWGLTNDADRLTDPDEQGHGGAQAIRKALQQAQWNPQQIEYICAHGTGTRMNDSAESNAMRQIWTSQKDLPWVSSLKPMIGHCSMASGSMELIGLILAMTQGYLPPAINSENPDPECGMKLVPATGVNSPIKKALKTSFGFGGQNACLAVEKWQG